MSYALVADLVVALHLAFVLFAVAGGFLVWRYPRLAWLHLPALLWAVGIELSGGICPLTPLENRLRAMAGEDGYAGGFVEHYVLPVLYPAGLTREAQVALGLGLAGLNAFVYARLLRRAGRGRAV
ncbi:MAG: DUF2784 domain-containing protein [Gammaproteobacteria bacterium]|jgi:hypothetical protein|nr:DUF2784 domain-containing protein [Gammaproteobacteria bacterium]